MGLQICTHVMGKWPYKYFKIVYHTIPSSLQKTIYKKMLILEFHHQVVLFSIPTQSIQ